MTIPAGYPHQDQDVAVIINPDKPSEIKFHVPIHRIKNDGRLEILLPKIVKRRDVRSGLSLTLEYFHQAARYLLKTRIEHIFDDDVPVLLLAPQPNPQRHQLREHFRLNHNMSVRYSFVEIPKGYAQDSELIRRMRFDWLDDPDTFSQTVQSVDMSGGGLALHTPDFWPVSQGLFLEFLVADHQIQVAAEVRVSQELPDGLFFAGIEFVGMSERDRERIIQFVFKSQQGPRE